MAILNNYSEDQLRLAAKLYYLDGLPQAEIARFVSVSQAQVSRLLAVAREQGIVQISVAEYDPRDAALERRLIEAFSLSFVAVIKTPSNAPLSDVRRTVAHFAAPIISKTIRSGITVAISGGRTMREVIHVLPEARQQRITVVQAMGNIDSSVSPVDAFELGRALAQRTGGSFLTLNTPAFVPDKKTRDALMTLDQIRSVHERMAEASTALIGIGTPDNSVFVERGILTESHINDLKKRGAVGEICGRFYDRNGKECESPWRDRVISITLEQLRNIQEVIAVVAGTDRTAAIAAAIKGRFLTSLVIDQGGANALLGIEPHDKNKSSQRKKK